MKTALVLSSLTFVLMSSDDSAQAAAYSVAATRMGAMFPGDSQEGGW
jgi:hypothetical protein